MMKIKGRGEEDCLIWIWNWNPSCSTTSSQPYYSPALTLDHTHHSCLIIIIVIIMMIIVIIIIMTIINILLLALLPLCCESVWWLFDNGDFDDKDDVGDVYDVSDVDDDDDDGGDHYHHHEDIDGGGSVLWQGKIGSQLCNLIMRMPTPTTNYWGWWRWWRCNPIMSLRIIICQIVWRKAKMKDALDRKWPEKCEVCDATVPW